MIEIKENVVAVNFAEHKESGVVGVGTNFNRITLQQLAKEMPVGISLNDADILELPEIVMQFNCVESVDVMIKALERIRLVLSIPLAC